MIQGFEHNRLIYKVTKTKHHNLEFGHRRGDIKKNLQKSTLTFKGEGGRKLRKPSIFFVIN
jgi:hypothetical protein